jgi:hypothetical protein
MPINKVDNEIVYTQPASKRLAEETGFVSDSDFAIIDERDHLKQLKFDVTAIPTNTTVTIAAPSASGTLALDWYVYGSFLAPISATSGTLTVPDYPKVYAFVDIAGVETDVALSTPTREMQELKIHATSSYPLTLTTSANKFIADSPVRMSSQSVITFIANNGKWVEQSRNGQFIEAEGGG